ncbi:MAG: TIGR01548 family HAD-type hydrolase [Microcoleaceae cyanobacterium]
MKAIAIFDIDGVLRDVGGSYRQAIMDTVEKFTTILTPKSYRPVMADIDQLKSEGIWNNDWHASQELIYRHVEHQGIAREQLGLDYEALVEFFQSRYQGTDSEQWNGYICSEPLLCQPEYFEQLIHGQIAWGFFSGAMRDEALYALRGRLGIESPCLMAMEDAPDKPDPTGLFKVIQLVESQFGLTPETQGMLPVVYAGDTVADLKTTELAQQQQPNRRWIGVGVLPPHVQVDPERAKSYREKLESAGAQWVIENIEQLTPEKIQQLTRHSVPESVPEESS